MSSNAFPATQAVGYGLMGFTNVPSRKFTQEQFDSVFKSVIDHSGATENQPLFVNGGDFYGIPDRYENIKLIGGFFKSHPDYADKIYLSIKGGTNDDWSPNASPENLQASVDAIAKYLAPLFEARKKFPKTLDVYTLARIGAEPVEESVKHLDALRKAGAFTKLCLSEVNANTLAKAASLAQIDMIEIEFSLFRRDVITNGLFAEAVKQGIPVAAYSPLGKGVLVGQKISDLPKDDFRNHFDRFADPNVVKNNETLVESVKSIGEKLNLTPGQVALSWITTLSGSTHNGVQYPRIIPIPGSTSAERQNSNQDVKTLDASALAEIDNVLVNFKVVGHRYNAQLDQLNDK